MTRAEFDEACLLVCPHCAKKWAVVQDIRGEWTHVRQNNEVVTSTICWANGLRNSRFAKEATSG